MSSISVVRLGLCCVIAAAFCACSDGTSQTTPIGVGGGGATGGKATGAGGSTSMQQGGAQNLGGSSTLGGATNAGGRSTGGGAANVGGGSTGGGAANVGGSPTPSAGGQSSTGGGSSTGGASSGTTGGKTSVGGASTGGANATGGVSVNVGGNPAGGTRNTTTGGASNGGTATGGKATGGVGGTATGGNATGGVGGTATGGAAAGGTAAGGGSGDPFVLAWEDDFTTLNTSTWQMQNFTWDGNQATFSPNNASVANGILTMALTNAASGAAKPYLGVEARSTKTLTYGKVSASMRFAKGSGVVSGLVLFYTPYPNCDWNEIDIEHLGKTPTSSQLNAMVYTGTYNASCTASVTPTQEPLVTPLGFDAEAAFHQYDIEWTPTGVKYFADGVLLRTWSTNISLLKRPMNILLTIWASNSADWAGALSTSSVPTTAQLDWIKVYDWKG